MKIKTKLFLSLIFIAILSMVISLNFSIIAISKRYEKMAREELAAAKKLAQSVFLENLSDLVRKALFLSELKEISENTERPDDLAMALEFKKFFFPNTNFKVLDAAGKVVVSFDNSSAEGIAEKNLQQIAFLSGKRDPLIREAGIFLVAENLYMVAVSPIIDQETMGLKGSLLLETPFSLEFTDQLKEKSRTDVMLYALGRPVTSTLVDSNGEMVFPQQGAADPDDMVRFRPGSDRYLLDSFAIDDYQKRRVGKILVAVNVEKIMEAKQVGIVSLITSSLLIAFFVILTSLLLGRRLTAPIVKLALGAEAIATGNFDVRLALESKDEIGELANVFNKMSESLKIQHNEILELQQFFKNIVDYSPLAIVIGNESAEIITMNPAAEKMLAQPLELSKGRPLFECLPLLRTLEEEYFKVLLSGHPCLHDNFSVFHADGEEKVLRLTMYKIQLPGAPALVLQMEDISEKSELEEKLLHAKKLGTLGELLSRFTHEFNNLMTSLLGHLGLLKKEIGYGHPHFKRTQMIEDVALRAYNLGKDILDFSKKEKLKKEPVEVGSAIETVLNLLGKTVLKRIDVETAFADKALAVLMNREKFLLALFNVLINAKDAIWAAQRVKGSIRIAVDRIFISREQKNFIRTRITDNGSGIEDRVIGKIFDPYFTTKGDKGTGLGLTTVKEIIEESAGWIEIEVEKNAGTTFILFLPEHTV